MNLPDPAQLVPHTPPLAWNEDGQAFELDREHYTHWLVRRETGGRPSTVFGSAGPIRLELDASWEQLRDAVGGKPGHYRLYPCDARGQEHKPVAHVEVVAEYAPLVTLPATLPTPITRAVTPTAAMAAAPAAAFDPMIQAQFLLYERYLQSHERHLQSQEILMGRLAETTLELARATAEIQLSSAKLLTSSADSVRVANGLDALDRLSVAALPAPPVQMADVNADADADAQPLTLADQVREALGITEAIREALPAEPKAQHPVVQLLTGPIGMFMLKFAQDLANGVAQAQAQAAKAVATAPPQPSTPPPSHPSPAHSGAIEDGEDYMSSGDEEPPA